MARKAKPKLDPDDWLGMGDAEDVVAESTSGIIVTKARLATVTGLSMAALDKAFEAGAPVVAKGNRKQGWQINTADFVQWYIRRKVDELTGDPDKMNFDQAKTAKMQAETRIKEMQLAKLEGETLTIDEAVALYREEATIIRSQFMAMPGRLAIPVAAESDPAAVEAMIFDEVNLALSNITGDSTVAWIGETDDQRERREDGERTNDRVNSADEPE